MSSALNIVQKFFPGVLEVVDAKRPVRIEVTEQDATKKGIKNHESCAMAVACKRKFNLDGVVISRSTAYLVKGRKARRFKLSPSVSREIVSFDRGAGFAPGNYHLTTFPETQRLGSRRETSTDGNGTGNGFPKNFRHVTTGIRTSLAGPSE